MKKLTLKSNKQESRLTFAAFMLAALFSQSALAILPQAMAQDETLPSGSSIYVSSEDSYSLADEVLKNKDDITLQDNIFLQSPCLTNGDCISKESNSEQEQVKTISVQKKINKIIVTAYSSTPDQTDSSPFITANGTYVYDGVVACNFLPFDTKVRFPELYGDKIFIVEDRMAKKNNHKMDIWMPSREIAMQFGVKRLAVEIVE